MKHSLRAVFAASALLAVQAQGAEPHEPAATADQCRACHQGAMTLRADSPAALAENIRKLKHSGKGHPPLPELIEDEAALRVLAEMLMAQTDGA